MTDIKEFRKMDITEFVNNIISGNDNEKPLNIIYNTSINIDNIPDDGIIICSGQIDKFFNYKHSTLEWRSLRFETEKLDTDNYQGNAVINYIDKKYPYTRIIEHKHFNNCQSPVTYITKEYPDNWDITKECYYPVINDYTNIIYSKYENEAKEKNIYFGGRLGKYAYYDMGDTIINAYKLCNKIIKY